MDKKEKKFCSSQVLSIFLSDKQGKPLQSNFVLPVEMKKYPENPVDFKYWGMGDFPSPFTGKELGRE